MSFIHTSARRVAATLGAVVIGLGLATCGGGGKAEKGERKESKGEHEEGEGEHEEGEHEEGEQAGMVKLTPEQAVTAKIAFVTVATRSVASELGATGEVTPPDDGVARIGPRLPGRITRLTRGVGDMVKKGETLALIDSPELGRAKADYIAADTTAKVARDVADREKALFDKKISSERDWRAAEAAATLARAEKEAAELRLHTLGVSDAQLGRLKADDHFAAAVAITSPIDGVVVERAAALGQMIEPADTMFLVMDLRTVWVMVDVYERDLGKVAIGHRVDARVAAWRDRVFSGTIQTIGAVLERRSRTIKVRVVLANPDGALKPGMFATVALSGAVGEPREGLFVPATAVQRDGDGSIVFVPVDEHEFQVRTVEVGVRTADWVEITRGLVAGDRVVTAGTFLLKSEARRESFGGHDH